MQTEEMRLDGNAAGGALREIFVRDMTGAVATCRSCGSANPLGTLLEYGHAMGIILRCPACNAPMLRLARTPGWWHLDPSGVEVLILADRDG